MNKEKLLTGDSFLLTAGGFLALCIQRMITFAIGFFLIIIHFLGIDRDMWGRVI